MTEATKLITHIDGVEILARQPALGRHPHPAKNGMLVPFKGIEAVILEDGRETNMCSQCGYTNDNVASVNSHHNAHSDADKKHYKDNVLKAVIQEVLTAKLTGRDYATRAAAALNERGITTSSGTPWKPENVSNVYNTYKARFPGIRARRGPGRPLGVKDSRPRVDRRTQHLQPELPDTQDDVPHETNLDRGPVSPVREVINTVNARHAAPAIEEEDDFIQPEERHGVKKALHNNRVSRIRKMLVDLANEMHYLERDYEEKKRKADKYDKLSLEFRGFSD